MENFISVIVFSLPGLLTYFWLQMFGINPTVKHSPTEMVGLAALLWAPTNFLTVLTYDLGYWLLDNLFKKLTINLTFLELNYLFSLKNLNDLSSNFIFLFFYLILSVLFSFVVAWIWSIYLYNKTMNLVNKVRIKRKISRLSVDTSVWDSFFFSLEEAKESPLIIEMYKIDKPEDKFYGAVTRMSRPFETERSLILDDSTGWQQAHQYYKYPIKKSYVDTKSGIIINALDYNNPSVTD
ncbi:hypothetical protein ABEY54_28895 [Priestia megaterium]